MSILRKPNERVYRPERGQICCVVCKAMCTPKEGDWHSDLKRSGQQCFLCKKCQVARPVEYKRISG